MFKLNKNTVTFYSGYISLGITSFNGYWQWLRELMREVKNILNMI